MINAKEELIRDVADTSANIKCVAISRGRDYDELDHPIFILREGHSEANLNAFLNSLDFEYDNGYGGQKLFGIVWLSDGTWLERMEYDGSEWWRHCKCPEIPEELKLKYQMELEF
jgi:hypothetical protein